MPGPRHHLGRVEFILMVSAMMALNALGIDLMLPAFDEMRIDLGLESNPGAISATVTAYLLGMGVGQLVYGVLADRFGRRPTVYFGLLLYAFGAVGSALAPTLAALVVARVIWGFGAAGGRVIAVTLVRDHYNGPQMAEAMSYVMSVFILVPVFAPTLGALIASTAGWRWIFWACAALTVAMGLWIMRLPESLRADDRLSLRFGSIGSAMARVVTNRVTGGYLLAMTLLMGVFISYLGSSELIIGTIFDYDDQFPLIFGAVAAVLAAAAFLNARIVVRFGVERVITGAWIGYVSIAGLLLVFTVAGGGVPNFWVFIVSLSLILGCHILLFPNMNSLAMAPMGEIAGTASSVLGCVTMAGGAVIGAMISVGIDSTITSLAVGFVAAGLASGATIAWVRREPAAVPDHGVVAVLEPN